MFTLLIKWRLARISKKINILELTQSDYVNIHAGITMVSKLLLADIEFDWQAAINTQIRTHRQHPEIISMLDMTISNIGTNQLIDINTITATNKTIDEFLTNDIGEVVDPKQVLISYQTKIAKLLTVLLKVSVEDRTYYLRKTSSLMCDIWTLSTGILRCLK